MKKALLLAVAACSLSLASVASAATTNHVATLSGAQEMPKVTTNATGSATLAYDDATKKLTGTLTMTGLTDVQLAHIHNGACGVNGGIEQTLANPTPSSVAIDVTLSAAQETALMTGSLYLNIHTTANGNGEMRGQIRAAGSDNTCTGGPTTVPTDGGGKLADSGTSSSSSGGAVEDDGGCNTSGTSGAGGGLLLAAGIGFGLTLLGRRVRRKQ